MEEKILIQSERYDVKKLFKAILITGAIISVIWFVALVSNYMGRGWGYSFAEAVVYVFEWCLLEFLIPFVAFALIGALIHLWLRSYEMIVTDKRTYGKTAWGKRVDLPLDSISATAKLRFLRGVTIATASGKIGFLCIKNAEEIYQTVSELLISRQQDKVNTIVSTTTYDNETEQIEKYKSLLDKGVITQEEFDAKKKQLLGL